MARYWKWRRTPGPTGCAFVEDAGRAASEARLLWYADVDPFVLSVRATPVSGSDSEAFDLARLASWATIVRDGSGQEHLVLSDGWHRIRVDVVEGTLFAQAPARLDYLLSGMTRAEAPVLRRVLARWRTGRFARLLFPDEPGWARRIEALRIGDAIAASASYREMAIALYGEDLVRAEWKGRSDFLLSRVRRRAEEARRMTAGRWRGLLGS